MPALRSRSTAFSTSPEASDSAFLPSIMPAPVFSRSCFTWSAVICMVSLWVPSTARRNGRGTGGSARRRLLRGAALGLGALAAERHRLLVAPLERRGARLEDGVRHHRGEQP